MACVNQWFSFSIENGRNSRKLDFETDFVCVCVHVWSAISPTNSANSENLEQSFAVLKYESELTLDI